MIDLTVYYEKITKDVNAVENIIISLDELFFSKFLILLKAYEKSNIKSYYFRAIKTLKGKGRIFDLISYSLENSSNPLMLSKALTNPNISEIMIMLENIDDPYSDFIIYLLNRITGNNVEALERIRRAVQGEGYFSEELSRFLIVYSFSNEKEMPEMLKKENKDFEYFINVISNENRKMKERENQKN